LFYIIKVRYQIANCVYDLKLRSTPKHPDRLDIWLQITIEAFRANKPESAEIVGYVFYCIPIPLGTGKTTHILFRSEFSDDLLYVV